MAGKDPDEMRNSQGNPEERRDPAERDHAQNSRSRNDHRRRPNQKSSAARRRRSVQSSRFPVNPIVAAGVVIGVIVLIFVIVKARSCGVNHGSAPKVVKELIAAEVEGKESRAVKCYGVTDDVPTDLKTEIDSAIAYFQAHEPKEVKIKDCDTIFDDGSHAYTYIMYSLILENDQEYPCLETFMTEKDEKGYNVLAAGRITADLQQRAVEAYKKFMTTDAYKNYAKEYETFMIMNRGYEEKIASKLT